MTDRKDERLLPQHLPAERALLASIMLDPQVINDIDINADDFHSESNKTIFGYLSAMKIEGRAIDLTLLLERMKESGDLEKIGGEAYIAEIMHTEATPKYAVAYAEVLREKTNSREAIFCAYEIIDRAYDGESMNAKAFSCYVEEVLVEHDESTGCISFRPGGYNYDIETRRISNAGELCRWILHLTEKGWFTNARLRQFIETVNNHCTGVEYPEYPPQ